MNKLSVVILNYNGKKHLEQFLPGVVSRSAPHEVVVVDNGSTDDSVPYVQEQVPGARLVLFSENHGFSGGYNKAIKEIESEYIVLLNSDVEVSENWIAPVLQYMEAKPEMAAAQPKILDQKNPTLFEYAGASGGYLDSLAFPFCRGRIFHTIEEDQLQYNDAREVFWASGSCLFVKRSAYLEAGGLDNDFFAHMEEIDLCWRFWNMGYKVGVCPQSHVFHVGGGTLDKSQPRKTYLNFRNGLSLILKNEPMHKLWWKLPIRMGLDWLAAIHFTFYSGIKHAGAIWKAHFHFLLGFRGHFKKRKLIVRKTTKNPRYRGLIFIKYFAMGQKRYSDVSH